MTEPRTVHTLPLPPPERAGVGSILLNWLLVACGAPLALLAIVVPIVTVAWLVRSFLTATP